MYRLGDLSALCDELIHRLHGTVAGDLHLLGIAVKLADIVRDGLDIAADAVGVRRRCLHALRLRHSTLADFSDRLGNLTGGLGCLTGGVRQIAAAYL